MMVDTHWLPTSTRYILELQDPVVVKRILKSLGLPDLTAVMKIPALDRAAATYIPCEVIYILVSPDQAPAIYIPPPDQALAT